MPPRTRPFPPYQQRSRHESQQAASTFEKNRGRYERRTLTSTTALNEFLDWPGVRQVYRLVRERTVRGVAETETVYGITSLSREKADAAKLLKLARSHWHIENRLFYVRDVTFGEDHCRVRGGSAPENLATVRNAAISLLRRQGVPNIAAVLREHALRLPRLLSRLGIVKN